MMRKRITVNRRRAYDSSSKNLHIQTASYSIPNCEVVQHASLEVDDVTVSAQPLELTYQRRLFV